MRKATKIWLITAVFLVIIGCAMFAAVMWKCDWDFTKLDTAKYETNTYEISEEFSDLLVNTDTADITAALSDDGKCRVECYEEENSKHSVAVQDNTLVIQVVDHKSWMDHIGIHFDSPKIRVYLPEKEYKLLDVNVSTGDIHLSNITCENFETKGSTGDIRLNYVTAEERISIKRNTGDVEFDDCDSSEVFIETDTGDVEGTFSSGKMFLVVRARPCFQCEVFRCSEKRNFENEYTTCSASG